MWILYYFRTESHFVIGPNLVIKHTTHFWYCIYMFILFSFRVYWTCPVKILYQKLGYGGISKVARILNFAEAIVFFHRLILYNLGCFACKVYVVQYFCAVVLVFPQLSLVLFFFSLQNLLCNSGNDTYKHCLKILALLTSQEYNAVLILAMAKQVSFEVFACLKILIFCTEFAGHLSMLAFGNKLLRAGKMKWWSYGRIRLQRNFRRMFCPWLTAQVPVCTLWQSWPLLYQLNWWVIWGKRKLRGNEAHNWSTCHGFRCTLALY